MSIHQWEPTRFDLPEHYAFVAYYKGASTAPEGKEWHAFVPPAELDSWHATADEAKAAVETHLAAGVDR